MITVIGDIIKSKLEPLALSSGQSTAFIDKLAGVVKIITKTDLDSNNKSTSKKFPVACNVSFEECDSPGIYKDLVPDSKLGCIIFLEDQGLRFVTKAGNVQQWKASYRMVGWVNAKKLGYTECSITDKVIGAIVNKLPDVPFASGNYQAIDIQIIGQEPKNGQNPFSKYSFDEDRTQFLMYPYDAFGLLIDVSFKINKKCFDSFERRDPIVC